MMFPSSLFVSFYALSLMDMMGSHFMSTLQRKPDIPVTSTLVVTNGWVEQPDGSWYACS
jgi:hypothetical protein